MRNQFVALVENKLREQNETNIEKLTQYIKSMTIFNLKDGIEDIINKRVSVPLMTQYAKSKGYYENGDVTDERLADFNKEFRQHVGLPELFGDVIEDEPINDVEDEEGVEDAGIEDGEEELQDDVEVPEGLVAPEQETPTQGVETEFEGGELDLEGRMAKRQLIKTCEYSRELCDMIQDEDQLPSWVQAKLTKVADYIGAVKHYIEAEKQLRD